MGCSLCLLRAVGFGPEQGSVAAGEVGVRVGVGDSATLVLTGHATTFESTTGHHMALGMSTVCKAPLPRTEADGWQGPCLVITRCQLTQDRALYSSCKRPAQPGEQTCRGRERRREAVADTEAFLPSHATPACCHMPMPGSCNAPLSTCGRDMALWALPPCKPDAHPLLAALSTYLATVSAHGLSWLCPRHRARQEPAAPPAVSCALPILGLPFAKQKVTHGCPHVLPIIPRREPNSRHLQR